jgi:hypothetical protein
MKKSVYAYAMIAAVVFGCELFGMDKSFHEERKELKKWHKAMSSHFSSLGRHDDFLEERHDLYKQYRYLLANLVKKAGNTISNQEKLEYLIGGDLYHKRKKIIKNMIEVDGIHPDNIFYQHCDTPLKESIEYKDILFTGYLVQKGAQHTENTLKLLDETSLFKILLNHKKIYQLSSEELMQLKKELEEHDKKWESIKELGLSWWIESGDGECEYREKKAIYNKFGVDVEEVQSHMQSFDEEEIGFDTHAFDFLASNNVS